MHRFAALLGLVVVVIASPVSAAEDSCKAEVVEAFTKQRTSKAFTMQAELMGESGPVTINVEYIPPDRMRQTIVAPRQKAPLETVLVGTRAWSRQGSVWKELMPAVAQTIIAQVRDAVMIPPKDVGEFECLGSSTIDGKEYLAYRSIEKQTGVPKGSTITRPVHRTVYVDPKSGLPTINVVAEDAADAKPIFKGVYEYPTDLVIEAHPDAPLAKVR
jgi:hypothetical protein